MSENKKSTMRCFSVPKNRCIYFNLEQGEKYQDTDHEDCK